MTLGIVKKIDYIKRATISLTNIVEQQIGKFWYMIG